MIVWYNKRWYSLPHCVLISHSFYFFFLVENEWIPKNLCSFLFLITKLYWDLIQGQCGHVLIFIRSAYITWSPLQAFTVESGESVCYCSQSKWYMGKVVIDLNYKHILVILICLTVNPLNWCVCSAAERFIQS